MSSSGEQIIVPRNFVLLEELEKAEKGNTDMSVSMGLKIADDVYMYDWQCTILGPYNTAIDGCARSDLSRVPAPPMRSRVHDSLIAFGFRALVAAGSSHSLCTAPTNIRSKCRA